MAPFFSITGKKYWLLGIILVFGFLFTSVKPFSGYTNKAYRRAKRQWQILTGGMIDVGGYYLRIECRGSGRTVVFDSGLNQMRDTWGTVPDEIVKVARVCTYDRAGVGESDDANVKRTSSDVVRELRTLLEKKGEKGPFVLVGHSFGGLNARLYAAMHPAEVLGLILVEPSHEDQYQKIADTKQEPEREQYLRHEGGENGERMDLLSSASEVRSADGPNSLPTILLTAKASGGDENLNSIALELNTRLGQRIPLTEHIVVENSGHFPQLDRPDVVIGAIRKLLPKN